MSFWETMKYKNNFVTARNVIFFNLILEIMFYGILQNDSWLICNSERKNLQFFAESCSKECETDRSQSTPKPQKTFNIL